MMKYIAQMQQVRIDGLREKYDSDLPGLIAQEERRYDQKIFHLCGNMIDENTRIILLTGPSASGKTTTSQKISKDLKMFHKKVHKISLDDFYKDHHLLPNWEDGKKNYESIEGLDLELFHQKMRELITKGRAEFPLFDFPSGNRSSETFSLDFDDETYLIVEGIHALNPLISQEIQELPTMRLYVSVHTDFVSQTGEEILSAREVRLMRRLLRDYTHRDTKVEETLALWDYVLRGEELYIRPYRNYADAHINSTHYYEPFLYKDLMYQMLSEPLTREQDQKLVTHMLEGLSCFDSIPKDMVPKDSLLQEFIG